MSTKSLRRDHDLIEKVTKSMVTTVEMLRKGNQIPELILNQVIDFTTNFIDVCHHSKEEKALFPALVKSGMPSNMGPIAVMLMEHEKSRNIAKNMKKSAEEYLKSNNAKALIADMEEYTNHITEHLWKENNRLFMMADMRLGGNSDNVDAHLDRVESDSLGDVGKNRAHYEEIGKELETYTTGTKNP